MEEADARLQEVVASLLNEHGGNYEPALRQTFACLHNSGLYEAQSPQEEGQREQQVIAVFRSFPFRTAATAAATTAAATDGADAPAEETQEPPPPAYETVHNTNGNNVDANDHHHTNNANNIANSSSINNNNNSSSSNSNNNNSNSNNNGWNSGREPEEAGEIAAAEGDPENVGEYPNAPVGGAAAATAAVPEALPPLYPDETHGEVAPAAGPELGHQQGEQQLQVAPSLHQQVPDVDVPRAVPQEAEPEGSAVAVAVPVAEYPASGPQDIVGSSEFTSAGSSGLAGGVLHEGVGQEWLESDRAGNGIGSVGGAAGSGDHYPETVDVGEMAEFAATASREDLGHTEGGVAVAGVAAGAQENADAFFGSTAVDGSEGAVAVAAGVGVSGYVTGAVGDSHGRGDGDPESTTGSLDNNAHEEEEQRRVEAAPGTPMSNGGTAGDSSTPPPSYSAFVNVAEDQETMDTAAMIAETPTPTPASPAAAVVPTTSAPPVPGIPGGGVVPGTTSETVPGAGAYAGGGGQAVSDPHLKTGGQPLTHENRAESPTSMATSLQDTLKQLKLRRKHRFVVMRIDGTEVVASSVGARGDGPSELKGVLPYSDCRYAVYDQELVTSDGRKTNKLFFFTWLPHNATPHNKMAYSHGKVTVRQRLEGLYDVAASTFTDIELALGLVEEDEEDSDIDF